MSVSHVTIYVDGINISTARVSVRQGDVIREIVALETYIGITKSEVLQRIAGDRIKELIKEIE